MEGQASDTPPDKDLYEKAKASKFHFKSRSSRDKDSHRRDKHSSKRHRLDEDRKSHRRHRESKHKRRRADDGTPRRFGEGEYYNPDNRHRESIYDGVYEEGTQQSEHDPDEAFRESLFDALADDEGAAYWEGVYGQPVHVYPNTKPGLNGELERMSEEEYAEFVRRKMWEKSHQHILEEREAREKDRKKRKTEQERNEEEAARAWDEREAVRRKMEESLKRGEERRKAKEAAQSWDKYVRQWDELKARRDINEESDAKIRDMIPWPVVSGKWKHVTKDEIERFLRASSAWGDDAAAMLKAERVRWHPDKMQQRFGNHVGSETMKTITAIFQIIDTLWNERRK
ncbi:hypothetical protein BS50DRAFT_566913 [Corynespora cassiicola Philippines]|uniref:Uncharacterized protein n=1 Tax=Corynespora cassiicola Philippines TaxID=1448308 RepID=A0A2T2P8L8_CORCC|nr:hypothetical protein BS50DRAFT_566913 [Corynespora cassiicola Philippines]